MMVHERYVAALMTSLVATACQPPGFGEFPPFCDPAVEVCPPGSALESSTGIDASTAGEPSTSTGHDAEETTTSSTSTTGELADPLLLEAAVTPNPVEHSGPVRVTAETELAEGVRMKHGDESIELVEEKPGVFVGELAVYSGLFNGPHAVTLTPWRADLDGESKIVQYAVNLPEPGTLGFWEATGVLGEGQAGAVAALPKTDEFVEAGTRFVDGEPRCYLRRRAKSGAWSDSDVVHVLPDEKCSVVDLAVDDDGLHLLAMREISGVSLWWLGRMSYWGGEFEHRGYGAPGEEATALASTPGEVAVCGDKHLAIDLDSFVAIFSAGETGVAAQNFDYTPTDTAHQFEERVADCVYNDDKLVLGGVALGDHNKLDGDPTFRKRGFLLEFDRMSGSSAWTVPETKLQSAVTALVIDDQKRVIAAGYTCDDVCSPAAELRGYDTGGGLFWQTDLPDVLPPQALAWSPAGYLIVASALPKGQLWTVFWLQAWRPGVDASVWTLSRDDAPSLQMARSIALGYYGLILGVGVGAGNVPAIAVVNG